MNQQTHTVEVIKRGDNLYYALIDGVETGIKARYKNVARRNAARWLREQAEKNTYAQMKEAGL